MTKSFSTLHSAAIVILLTASVLGVHEGVSKLKAPRIEAAPGDDFFAYANGAWLAKARIPPGKGRWGARDEIAAATSLQVSQVIRKAGSSPNGAKVAAFFSAYLDETTIERRGFASLKPALEEIDRIQDTTDLSRYLGAHLLADVDPLGTGVYDSALPIGFAASYGMHGESEYVPYLTQGGLGLGNRDAYLAEGAEHDAARKRYGQYIGLMLATAGFDHALRREQDVMALEMAMARSFATQAESSNDANADNRWARGDFMLQAPGLDWGAFFAAAGLAKQRDFVVWQPQAIRSIAALVAAQPLESWKDYLRFHLLDRYADVLPHRFADLARDFHQVAAPRRQRALEATSRMLPERVGRLYVARYFPPERKARVQGILDQVVAAAKRRVASAPWISHDARLVALTKLESMYFGVGYPEQWPDDSALEIDALDALGNVRRVEAWRHQQALAKLGREVDRREWAIAPQSPGAVLNFQLNAYNFSAALLQAPKFDPAASDAANYGAIGAIFAHEITHFVDTLGAEYDAQGAAHAWWKADDKAKYEALARPLVAQFAAYQPLSDVRIDGTRTLTENFADLAGLAVAFDAYRSALGAGLDAEALRARDREFFIGFARSWRATTNDDALRTMVKGDSHAPEAWRIATVRNLDAWYEAFDVKPGHQLYLPPEERVHVW